eukprot:CAMPEP_0174286872 /NCGR_PEP_ID=MMETSP0809-20121228/13536_1 /TAXON_ID=73025 ORGANISM="Eutreptiella gymnastica-like, Strain CCMP1594" /NCGR_SAMPLE_ID=MMETSP0809 /ASSEMBLY_ACC=CAM_ASM_000658 /LENGTH=82 /DNA_ID=CAMNT_0015383129 /DNA_START=23 /DNA_END=271 /DNA_ORIENTATION=+
MGKSNNQLRKIFKKQNKVFIAKKPPKSENKKKWLAQKTKQPHFQKMKREIEGKRWGKEAAAQKQKKNYKPEFNKNLRKKFTK